MAFRLLSVAALASVALAQAAYPTTTPSAPAYESSTTVSPPAYETSTPCESSTIVPPPYEPTPPAYGSSSAVVPPPYQPSPPAYGSSSAVVPPPYVSTTTPCETTTAPPPPPYTTLVPPTTAPFPTTSCSTTLVTSVPIVPSGYSTAPSNGTWSTSTLMPYSGNGAAMPTLGPVVGLMAGVGALAAFL